MKLEHTSNQISLNRRRYAALCRRVVAQLQCALLVFSVKVVRHKKQEVFCGRLWKKAGATFGEARKYGTIGPSANSVAFQSTELTSSGSASTKTQSPEDVAHFSVPRRRTLTGVSSGKDCSYLAARSTSAASLNFSSPLTNLTPSTVAIEL